MVFDPPILHRGLVAGGTPAVQFLGDEFIDFKGELGEVDIEVEEVFLIEVLGGGEDETFLFGFGAEFFGEVEGEGGGFEVFDVGFVDEIDLVFPALADVEFLLVEGGFIEFFAGGGVEDVAGEVLVFGQAVAGEDVFEFDGRSEVEVAEGAAETVFEVLVFGVGDAFDDAADTFGGDFYYITKTHLKSRLFFVNFFRQLYQDKTSIAAIFFV